MSSTIDVGELQVGMFVHLDLGWMAHPFPFSSFRISSTEQIEKIRSLGLQQVRWSLEKSELGRSGQSQESPAVDQTDAQPDPAEALRDARRQLLSQHRAAQLQCERQYVEATRAWRSMSDKVSSDPAAAREAATSLSEAVLDKMLVDGELSIRMLADVGTDRSASHAMNVTLLSLLLGRVFGLARADMMELGLGAMLHDIGKIDLPDRVRFADHHLSSAEQAAYREHVVGGVRHGRAMGLPSGALLVIAQHHEQCDGSGFPQKLSIDNMSAAARIVSLINRYDNLCNPLLLSKALTPHEALSLMFAQGRNKFDVTMLSAFIRMMGVYPPGSVVQLTDDRYAMVITVNSSRPLKPRVLIHDPKVPRDEALVVDLAEEHELGVRRSLKPSQLPRAALDYLSPRPRVAYFFEPTAGGAREDHQDAKAIA